MTIRFARIAFVGGWAMLFAGLPARADVKWELLGTSTYQARPVRDEVDVGGQPGGFQAIRMEVRQSDVEILDLKVIYGNGDPDDIQVRELFKAGTSSRVIDLKGGRRQIKKIVVTYLPRGPAKILFFGIAGAVPPKWDELGCQSVGFGVDRDVIRVGRKEGQFTAIKLRVTQAPIEIFDLTAVFGNGRKQDIRVRSVFKPGTESGAIDLNGKVRGLDRIEMVYRSIPTFKGKAVVCVEGLQARP